MAGFLEKAFTSKGGQALAARAGLAAPPDLMRGRRRGDGPVVLASGPRGGIGARTLADLALTWVDPLMDVPDARSADEKGRPQPPRYDTAPSAIIIDATGIRTLADLEFLRQVLRPAMRGLAASGRVIVLAMEADAVEGMEAKAAAQAIDGIVRTVGKELRRGATANLIWLAAGTASADLASSLWFLLQGRSAFVSGQVWRVAPGVSDAAQANSPTPFTGRVVVVTGAARGIGAAITRTFHRDGATLVVVDMPSAGESLAAIANEVGGSALQLDITGVDAGARIAAHVASIHGPDARIWAMVHNAGITRDRMLANLDEVAWAQVVEVNLAAEMRINAILLDPERPGGLAEGGRIIGVASTSGWAGNKGQANYAASKAGVMGLVWAQAAELVGRGITVNGVAPGFIETDMTAAIPFVMREVFRRSNSLSQGGQPVDVAETIAWLCDPASGGVNGQVIRVCGQNMVGR